MKSIKLKQVTSVVTESDVRYELQSYGPTHYQGFSSGKGEAFEIRTLICNLKHVRDMDDNSEIKNSDGRWKFSKVKSGNTTVTIPFTFSE